MPSFLSVDFKHFVLKTKFLKKSVKYSKIPKILKNTQKVLKYSKIPKNTQLSMCNRPNYNLFHPSYFCFDVTWNQHLFYVCLQVIVGTMQGYAFNIFLSDVTSYRSLGEIGYLKQYYKICSQARPLCTYYTTIFLSFR